MNGRRAKQLRRMAQRALDASLHDFDLVTRPKAWFRLYCRWARLRAALGAPIPPERMKRMARLGIRRELRPKTVGGRA